MNRMMNGMNGMNGMMRETMSPVMNSTVAHTASCDAAEPALVSENCKVSSFSLAAFAGTLLLCVGIVVYALLTA